MPLTLASQSPRRAKILAENGVDFEVAKTDAPEVSLPHDPERTVVENASRKLAACPKSPALAADTIVWFELLLVLLTHQRRNGVGSLPDELTCPNAWQLADITDEGGVF